METYFFAAVVTEGMLVFFSFITCQLIRFNYIRGVPKWLQRVAKFFLFTFALMGIAVNAAPVGFVLCTWIEPQVLVFNVSYLFNVENVSSTYDKIPSIALRDMTKEQAHSLSDIKVIDNMSKFEVFSKLVIFFLTLSSFLSYILFIGVLVCTYECNRLRKFMRDNQLINDPSQPLQPNKKKPDPLDPFCFDDKDKELMKISTKLYLPESLYFFCLFVLNLLLWIACFVLFSVYHFGKPFYTNEDNKDFKYTLPGIEAFGFAMYMYSLLCTIVSCFVFSKIAYSVTHRCLDLYEDFEKPQEKNKNEVFDWLVKQDDKFTKMAQQTLHCFEFWFTVHWVFYTVTSFLSIALVFDILIKYIQAELNNPSDSAIGFSDIELWLVGLFTLQHCFLFLYPCFKAAAVTVGREKLIKKVNAHTVEGHPLTPNEKQLYIQHLKNKKFGFRISFFCARLRFGFNVAYISIFIGLSGVLLKLTDLF